jgi:hypothetical protein
VCCRGKRDRFICNHVCVHWRDQWRKNLFKFRCRRLLYIVCCVVASTTIPVYSVPNNEISLQFCRAQRLDRSTPRPKSRDQKRPCTLPSSSRPTSQKPGRVPKPGIVCISYEKKELQYGYSIGNRSLRTPHMGTKKPAPAYILTDRIGTVKPKKN